MKNEMKEISDFYGQRVYSRTFGYGKLTRVYSEEIYITYEAGGSYIYRENPFNKGTVAFCDPELSEQFNVIYEGYTRSAAGKHEIYDTWFHRGS